jgi:hypothetical protein
MAKDNELIDKKLVAGNDSDDPRLRDAQGAAVFGPDEKNKDPDGDVDDALLRDAQSAVTWGV